MIFAYQHLEDAWQGGVETWCRAAAEFVLDGGEAWLLPAGPGQAGWLKRRLLRAGVPLFGLKLLGTGDLRRALCLRLGTEPPPFGDETLELLLRVHASREGGAGRENPAARQPAGCLAMLQDLDAAGWLTTKGLLPSDLEMALLPSTLRSHLTELRRTQAWTPELDRGLRERAAGDPVPGVLPLAVCVLGWDAGRGPCLDLLTAALLAGEHSAGARAFLPLPRGEALDLGQGWLEAVAAGIGAEDWETCLPARDTPGPLAELVERLESLERAAPEDEDTALAVRPEMLVGRDWADTVALARDWIARWLLETAGNADARLAVLVPERGPSAVALGRALGAAGIVFEDQVGERPETPLPRQIARAVVDYHLDETGTAPLLTLVGLLNDHPECLRGHAAAFGLPLDPVALRRALAQAFTDLQHTNARLLTGGGAFDRTPLAGPVRRLVAHLDCWPETLTWGTARERWEACLRGFNLDPSLLEPLWSRGAGALGAGETLPCRAFFEYLRAVLAGGGSGGARALPEGGRKFARVVLSRLAEAAGQTWHSAVFLDSNEGVWPRTPGENPFLDDRRRARLNARREELRALAEDDPTAAARTPFASPGHLLTGGDRARLEACRFYELLENCDPVAGQVAFASVRRDPAEPEREAHPNEWSLRCWIEAASAGERAADGWLERWRASARAVPAPKPTLGKAEAGHLRATAARRRDPGVPFDEYLFNFRDLGAAPAAGELGFEPAWSARGLEGALRAPATFALAQVFGVEPWRAGGLAKTEAWAVGRLVHRWVESALGGGVEPRPLSAATVATALGRGLARARRTEEAALRRALFAPLDAAARDHAPLPPWWQSVLAKTTWATRRCLEALAARVGGDPGATSWFCMNRELLAEVPTPAGPLRLRGRADLLLLDRPALGGAACQVVDVKTGGSGGAPSLAQAADGKGLGLSASLFLALAHGVEPARASLAVLHPEGAAWEALSGEAVGVLASDGALRELAGRQRGLRFGQGTDGSESLPLATVFISGSVLTAKRQLGG